MKGGIGSSSRQMEIDGQTYTLGVLAQTNYGASDDFRAACLPPELAACDQGSIILIVATDLPLSARQLKRVLRRTSVGMARLGSYIGHGSGEIAVGFTTAKKEKAGSFSTQRMLNEDLMNLPFRAAGECAEEAILQSMLHAEADVTLDRSRVPSLRAYLVREDLENDITQGEIWQGDTFETSAALNVSLVNFLFSPLSSCKSTCTPTLRSR